MARVHPHSTGQLLVRCLFVWMMTFSTNSRLWFCAALSSSSSFNNKNNNNNNNNQKNPMDIYPELNAHGAFSLSAYHKARAKETFQSLDATRLHLQILFVDDDNAKGRIAQGLLNKIAEYNDAMFVLFPASATITNAYNAPRDAAPPANVLRACQSLGIRSCDCEEMGTAFDLSYHLDTYDLVIAMDEEIRSLILRSVQQMSSTTDTTTNAVQAYSQTCRSFSEFLNFDFCASLSPPPTPSSFPPPPEDTRHDDMDVLVSHLLETDLLDRVTPYYSSSERTINHPNAIEEMFRTVLIPEYPDQEPRYVWKGDTILPNTRLDSWPLMEASMILGCAGITKFCLDTIEQQLTMAFETLLDRNFYQWEQIQHNQDQQLDWETMEEQLMRCNASVCGYFSPQQRKEKFTIHCQKLFQQQQCDGRDPQQQPNKGG